MCLYYLENIFFPRIKKKGNITMLEELLSYKEAYIKFWSEIPKSN